MPTINDDPDGFVQNSVRVRKTSAEIASQEIDNLLSAAPLMRFTPGFRRDIIRSLPIFDREILTDERHVRDSA